MPPWSYGNRLYRTSWYEPPLRTQRRPSKLEIGPYRHQAGYLYRRFQHSWPLFRRHVALTARYMVRSEPLHPDQLEPTDQRAVLSAERDHLPYLHVSYWSGHSRKPSDHTLYNASFDLKEFFPSVNLSRVIEVVKTMLALEDDDPLVAIIKGMIRFRVDHTGISETSTRLVSPSYGKQRVDGLPTGLFVAGFLSNLAMLSVDQAVDDMLDKKRSIAHFRFVDDHTVLSYNFDDLCEWITTYGKLLRHHDIGPTIGTDKYQPESLGRLINRRDGQFDRTISRLRTDALLDSRIDGSSPSSLLTPTLAQVSAIAAADPNTLDDNDLRDLLSRLEWLLLADVPDRELRADTRKAFAAGRIATTAPFLAPRSPEIILASRLATVQEHKRDTEFRKLEQEQRLEEERHYRYYFDRLMQAFREYPGNIRLFRRLHVYCLVTGFPGLGRIAKWIVEIRGLDWDTWAHYYAGLSLHILTHNVATCLRHIGDANGLRSDKEASLRHLIDIGEIPIREVLTLRAPETWYHADARVSFGVALQCAVVGIPGGVLPQRTLAQLSSAAEWCLQTKLSSLCLEYKQITRRQAGVWAHFFESRVATDSIHPSAIWCSFESALSYSNKFDRLALRRYPLHIANSAWKDIVLHAKSLKSTDSGWVREAMMNHPARIDSGRASVNRVLKRAAKSYALPAKRYMTLLDWTQFHLRNCDSFDPRASEWTALEILRQIVESYFPQGSSFFLHPANVLIPKSWSNTSPNDIIVPILGWDEWRTRARTDRVRLRTLSTSIFDYRYFPDDISGLTPWDRRLVALGRILLGILSRDYRSPPLWNLRGNERSIPFPRGATYASIAISSPTIILAEACLNPTVAETRVISRAPVFFGLDGELPLNETRFAAPTLESIEDLVQSITHAQTVLQAHQLSVSERKPRQLIPFRLPDLPADETVEEA